MDRFDGQRILVVGASSGIGLATAKSFAAAGAQVALASRGGEKLERAVAEVGVKVRHLRQDFERDRALAGDDVRIVVRMHPDEIAFGRDRLGARLRLRDSPSRTTAAPSASVAFTFTNGVVTGMTMVAGMAPHDRPPPGRGCRRTWITPRRRSLSLSAASFTHAPRSLKASVTWRFSYLTKTSAPVKAESGGAGNVGVRSTCPPITRRAASISASVTTAAPLGSSFTVISPRPERPTTVRPSGLFPDFRRRYNALRTGGVGHVFRTKLGIRFGTMP